MTKKFRINAKNLFLTYSQIDKEITHLEILEQLQTKLDIKKYIIAIEEHSNKLGIHSHVLLCLPRRYDIRSESFLDLNWKDKIYHGNYQSVRNLNHVIKYIIKENNYIKSESFKLYTNNKGELISLKEHILIQARKNGINKALKEFIDEDPNKAVSELSIIEKNLKGILHVEKKITDEEWPFELAHIDKSTLPLGMQHLTGKDLKNLFNNKAVAIVGKAGYGKTFLAKTLAHSCGKKPLFIKHYEGIKNFDESKHNSIVFDDANLRDLKSEQDILNLLDIAVKGAKSDLRHLYGCKRIPNDTQLILTVNDLKQLFGELTRQINRRLNIFELDQKIQLNVNVDNSIKIIFNQHNHIYNNEEDMERNRRIWDKQNIEVKSFEPDEPRFE